MTSIKAKNVNHPDYTENLNEQKYTIIREAILSVLPAPDSGESMAFQTLEDGVHAHLEANDVPKALFPKPGSVRWYTKTVQLDLEARGEIERVPNQSPIHLRRLAAN